MLAAGLVQLGIIFVLNYLTPWAYFAKHSRLPRLVARILLTSLPWYLRGITGHLLCGVDLPLNRPGAAGRISDLPIAVGVVRIFFLSSVPEAHTKLLPRLAVYTAAAMLLPQLPVSRFEGGMLRLDPGAGAAVAFETAACWSKRF
ncbi:MAG: hypothetical protein ACLR8Y_14390 [Alistipes indistinctus]